MRVVAVAWLTVAVGPAGASPLAAQSAAVEHWLITSSVPGRPDSVTRHARVRWEGDSLFGEVNSYERFFGSVRGLEMRVVGIASDRPVQIIAATRGQPGTITGRWASPEQPGQSGNWRAERIVGATEIAELQSGDFERWTISRPTFDDDSIPRHLRLRWKGNSFIGQIGPDSGVVRGTVRDGHVQLLWLDNSGFAYRFDGRQSGPGAMRGPFASGNGPQRGEWHAKRDEPRRPARTVIYAPTGSITHYAATNAPALHVVSGDTVHVRGVRGAAVPPVYVDGAYRGDVLAVHILSVRPSATRAASGNRLDVNWLMPGLVRTLPEVPFRAIVWKLDTIAGVAQLDPPMPRLGTLTIPLRPHVGMIGVAPAATTVMSTQEEGAHGGNLDFNALGEGVTLYLPVSHAGALLSVGGDVHAAQGDGELAHNGLEVFADLVFSVEVMEGRPLNWVRGEDTTHLMAFGSSEDLNVALRLATTHLVEWLVADYRLDDREVAALIGSAVELDIANVFGQQRTVVARVRKSLLRPPAR